MSKDAAMSDRRRRRTAAAVVLAAAVTALVPTLANAATPAARTAAPILNGTRGNGLTISNGTRNVVMNGTVVRFGSDVRDLAWNPSGTKAAYIDSWGDLETANANGTDRNIVAIPPRGVVFFAPTWQVTDVSDVQTHEPALDNLIFTAGRDSGDGGSTWLESISANVHFGRPTVLSLWPYVGHAPLPQTGNAWPSAGGSSYNAIFAYQNVNGEVYIHDDYLRAQGGAIGEGESPAVSPDGDEVAFVRSVAGHDHIFVEDLTGNGGTRDITPSAKADFEQPTWSADGNTIAFESSTGGIDTVSRTGGAVTRVSGYEGLPAYRG